ncbi:hypothetical protein AAFF_G00271200 [Aldrovandia affinis]|uniref:Alpha-1,3-mannosyl-glycoprotein 4-beta-N-acetylglucosaminyltransferase C n=1 Tax=Aldrovandia affinis TaxID=143900 RepID=A0AAD7W2E7_9TELE|nr:hypothetical protein AAFF_G00271200 [Aldrovandia affinis]
MRLYWKRTFTGSALCVAFTLLYLAISHRDAERTEVQLLARAIVSGNLNSARSLQVFQDLTNDSVPFDVAYSVLTGSLKQTHKYLTVGLSSIKRKRGSYLLDTLASIFSQSSEQELDEMVVVVFLADFDAEWKERTAKDISDRFALPIFRGQLLVVHAPQDRYPPLDGLKRNFNDKPDRVRFRSKQNVDYAFLLGISANLSTYYLMLEDDVACAKNFLTSIKRFIQSRGQTYWVTLEFSKLGYIGKLYHSSDLPQLAKFLLLFYQEMPCDWLLTHFNSLLTQKDTIRLQPSLFQHVGLYSSFGGTLNRLKDEDFEAEAASLADNPPADVLTDIEAFEKYTAEKAYGDATGYFWGKSPAAGRRFTVVLHKPAIFTRVLILTGSADRKKDVLESAEVEVGRDAVRSAKGAGCSQYFKLGPLEKGRLDRKNIQEGIGSALSCLRITVTKEQQEWVIIQKINIWTRSENATRAPGS